MATKKTSAKIDGKLTQVQDWKPRDKQHLTKPGFRLKHVSERRVYDHELDGWKKCDNQNDALRGHILMELPFERYEARTRYYEEQHRVFEEGIKEPKPGLKKVDFKQEI